MTAIKTTLKFAGLWLALLVGTAAAGMLVQIVLHPAVPVAKPDGPFDVTQALLLTTAAYAAALSLYAARLRGGFISRATTLFGLFYVTGSLLSLIETLYFNRYIHLPMVVLAQTAPIGLVQALVAAPVAAALWRGVDAEAETISGLGWRIALIAPLYIVFYFGAGQFIAWQGAAVRAYYDQAAHIDLVQLAGLQVGRGLIWAGLAWLSVRRLTGPAWVRALITGVAFAILMVMPLLFPNPFMPWAVRKMHFVEIATSNLLFGILAAGLLLSGLKTRKA